MASSSYSWVSRTRLVRPRRLAIAALCGLVAGAVLLFGEQQARSPERARYDGYAAVHVEPRSADELAMVLGLSVDVWSEQISEKHPVVVVLTPTSIDVLAASGVPYEIVIEDIQAVADEERTRLEQRVKGATASEWFSEYRDVREVSDYMDMLGERYQASASLRRLGTSVDGWPIRAIEISRGGKIGIVLNGGQHAREWISVMVTTCIADRLLSTHASDPRVRKILDSVRFFIVPLVNPDGYLHSWNVDRYWRKNRRGGHGVDLNRNFGVAWGQAGSSGNQRSEVYRGKHAFSEPEAQAMRSLFTSENISAHIDFHSYSQLILYPWNYKSTPSPDRDKLAAVADKMSSAIFAEHGMQYKIQSGAQLYAASGTFSDWTYGEQGALSFVIELRPRNARGRGGFVLPPEQIVPTCDESFAAVLELAEWTIRDGPKSSDSEEQ